MQFIDNLDKDKYIEFATKHAKAHFLQSYEWGKFCESVKSQIPHYVGMIDDEDNLVACAL